ncbi:hypothetical protein D9M72_336990 [compost metagenome]
MIGRLFPILAATDAKLCRRSWMRRSSRPAFFRRRPQGPFTLTRCWPLRPPTMTYGLSNALGSLRRTSRAASLSTISFLPVLESGRRSRRCSRSTYSHRSVVISDRRAPVRIRSRIAAIMWGLSAFDASASASTSPRRFNSPLLRYRSRLFSRNLASWRHGLVLPSRRPHCSARLNIFDSTANARLPRYGLSRRSW